MILIIISYLYIYIFELSIYRVVVLIILKYIFLQYDISLNHKY